MPRKRKARRDEICIYLRCFNGDNIRSQSVYLGAANFLRCQRTSDREVNKRLKLLVVKLVIVLIVTKQNLRPLLFHQKVNTEQISHFN